MTHCWMGKREYMAEKYGEWSDEHVETFVPGGDGTCMLEDGHEGEHEFTADSEIEIVFSEAA